MNTVQDLADTLLELLVTEDPLDDGFDALPGHDHLLPDVSSTGRARLRERATVVAAAAAALPPPADPDDVVTLEVVRQQAGALVDRVDAALHEHTMVGYDTSPLGRVLGALPQVRPDTPEREEAYLERLRSVPAYLDAAAERHRTAVADGRTPVAERAAAAIARLDAHLAAPSRDPLARVPLTGPAAGQRDRLLDSTVRPALARYRDVLATEVAPHGRSPQDVGLCRLPGGEDTYAALVRGHTTTTQDAKGLHDLGLELMDGITEELVGLTATVAPGARTARDVHDRVRQDPSWRWRDGAEMTAAAQDAVARAARATGDWFRAVPAEPCDLRPSDEPGGALAYYLPPAGAGRPGTFVLNTHAATDRARFLVEATAFHEAVPGHHLQMGLVHGLSALPALRRFVWVNAYIEGWGLYAERLADEMGLYSDQVARLGMVTMDALRAARLVVDTGIHALGWSRERAVTYLRESTALAEVEIQSEVDRYIELPGQALSYMVGRLELLRLRDRARARLGARFRLPDFHDVVLANGPLPLGVLSDVLARWERTR